MWVFIQIRTLKSPLYVYVSEIFSLNTRLCVVKIFRILLFQLVPACFLINALIYLTIPSNNDF